MGGVHLHTLLQKCTAILLSTFIGVALSLFPFCAQKVFAVDTLDLVRDQVYTNEPSTANIDHNIYFVLPVNSEQVVPTDWILIEFTNYTNVTAPQGSLGGVGTPSYSVVGNTSRVTGLAILPGGSFNVQGITASTPPINVSQQVIIRIAEDAAGTMVKNQAVTLPIAQGGNISVSATVESQLSSIDISGYTAPNSFTTLTENGIVIGTTVASPLGFFNFLVNALPPGDHIYTIFSTDTSGRTTTQSTLNVFLLASSTTTITNILLSPTIEISDTEIDPGDPITVSGSGKPSSQINIFLEAPLRSYVATTDLSGDWTYTVPGVDTATFTPGQYLVYTNLQDGVGNQSIASPTVTFRVTTPDGSNPPPACDISEGDLNCDSITNLVDFSILLFHWQTNHRVADINSDGKVNLTDFSIMMFYFTR